MNKNLHTTFGNLIIENPDDILFHLEVYTDILVEEDNLTYELIKNWLNYEEKKYYELQILGDNIHLKLGYAIALLNSFPVYEVIKIPADTKTIKCTNNSQSCINNEFFYSFNKKNWFCGYHYDFNEQPQLIEKNETINWIMKIQKSYRKNSANNRMYYIHQYYLTHKYLAELKSNKSITDHTINHMINQIKDKNPIPLISVDQHGTVLEGECQYYAVLKLLDKDAIIPVEMVEIRELSY